MNEMAAEVADGVLVMPFNSGTHMAERTMPAIDRGLATAGRTRDDFEIIVEVIVGVGRNDEELERGEGRAQSPRLLRLDACVPARARRPWLGRRAAGAEPPLQAGRLGHDGQPDHRRDGRHDRRPRHPR